MNYQHRQVTQTDKAPTVKQVVQELRRWDREHKPTDLGTRLNLFQYIQNVYPDGSMTGGRGALVPLAKGVTRLPQIELRDTAHDQMLARLQYGKPLYSRLPEKLNALNINWLIQNEGDRSALLRMVDKNQARALMTTAYQPFDNLDLMEAVLPYVGNGKVKMAYTAEDVFQITIIFPKTKTKIKTGDVVERGIYIRNSEIGKSSVTIAGVLWRANCLNQLIGHSYGGGNYGDGIENKGFKNGRARGEESSFVRFRHTGDTDRLQSGIQSAIESCYLESTKLISQFKQSLKVAVDDPASRLQKIVEDNDLTPDDFRQMLDNFMTEPDKNMFGVVNAITATARDRDGDDQYQLQRVASRELATV
jgi:hypothetical protein